MTRYLINLYTDWCGEDNTYAAYANDEKELDSIAEELAYENFADFNGPQAVLETLFPEEIDYTYDMEEKAAEVEGEYYGYSIEPWDESRPEKEWNWYDVVYDGRKENPFEESTEEKEITNEPTTKYNIYAGLGGGFGGAKFQYTKDFKSLSDADYAAYEEACAIYESQQGIGLLDYDDFVEQARELVYKGLYNNDVQYELAVGFAADELETASKNSWIEYYAERYDPNNPPE